MRAMSLVAMLALVTAACGGEKKSEQAAPAETTPAATGATHDVYMDFDGKVGKFDPAELTIKAGDVVNFHNRTGGPHNVSFWADSIPAGAASVLDANMADRVGPLAGPMLVDPTATYSVSFAGAPTGTYHVYCLPHLAFKMHGTITVQ